MANQTSTAEQISKGLDIALEDLAAPWRFSSKKNVLSTIPDRQFIQIRVPMEIEKLWFLVLNHVCVYIYIHIHSEVDKFDATRDGIKSSWSIFGQKWECSPYYNS